MEPIDIDFIRKDQSVDDRVLEVYELLKKYKDASARSKWMERRRKNWAAIENDMSSDDSKTQMAEKGQRDVIVNKCVEGVEGSAAIVTDQKPELKFLPIGSGDLYVAELMKRGFDKVWEDNEGNDDTYEVVEEQRIGGHGFFNAYPDKSKDPFGAIVIEEDPPDDIYWDPKSKKRDYSDTPLIKAKLRSPNYIKTEYGSKILSDDDIYFSPTGESTDEKSQGVTGGDNYTEPPDHSIDKDALEKQRNIWEIEAWMLEKREQNWQFEIDENNNLVPSPLNLKEGEKVEEVFDFDNPDPEAKAPPRKDNKKVFYWKRMVTSRIRRIIVGKKLISEDVNPYGVDREGDAMVTLIGYKGQKTLSAYCMSRTDYALPLNRSLNKRRAQAHYLISTQYGGTLVTPDGTKWINKGKPDEELRLSKTAQFQPYRLSAKNIDAQLLLQMVEADKADINDVYHLQDVVRGKLPQGQGQIAGRTVLALQDFAGMMSKPDMRKLESALIRLAKIIAVMMLKYWPRVKWERLLEDEERLDFAPEGTEERKQLDGLEEEDEKEQIQKVIAQKWEKALELIRPKDLKQPPGLSLLEMDVKITAGSSMPTNRIAKMEMAMELYGGEQGKGIYDREAALEYIDDPMKDKILMRMKKQEELMMEQAAMKGLK
jgi:hypothetical protein